jgi:hypothetical protein
LKEQVEALMEQDQEGKFMKQYKNARGQMQQKEYPISETYIHHELDKIHNTAFRLAWKALEMENENYADTSVLEKYKRKQLQQGDTQGATRTQGQLDQLLKLN